MEITILCVLSAFTFLLFYLTHKSYDRDHPNLRTIELRLLSGFFFIILGLNFISILYLIPNGSPSSLTPYVITNELWQRGLVYGFILFGIMQVGFAIMDALEYRSFRRSMAEDDDSYERSTTIEFERYD